MIGQAIYARLTATGTQTAALVAADAQGGPGVYPDFATKNPRPNIVYDADDGDTQQGYGGPVGLTSHTVTVICVGDDRLSCEQLADAVKADLDGQSGTWGGSVIQGVFLESGDAQIYPVTPAAEVRLLAKDLEFIVWKQS